MNANNPGAESATNQVPADAISVDRMLDDAGMPHPHPAGVHRHQLRMACRLAQFYADRLMHVHGLGWFSWDGQRWVEDQRGAAHQAVYEELRRALRDSLDDKTLREDVRRCETASGVKGVLDLAAHLPEFACTAHDLDADPYLFNTASGTLDLHTMALRPARPTDRITKVARGAYDPEAVGSGWPVFLERVLPDAEVRRFVQRLVGVGLVGAVLEQILAIFTGTGANGKSVFYGAVNHALGDYASVAEPDLFMHREGAHPTGEMDLRGVRWVVVSETDKQRRLAEATMKRLTGGDEIKARRMRQDFVSFKPSHTPVLITNHLPQVSGDDPALWRRILVVPFKEVIPSAEQDPRLSERLRLEADAILTWAAHGCADYNANGGLRPPAQVRGAIEDYRRGSDAVGRFIEDCCIKHPDAKVTTAEAFERWESWAEVEGSDSMNMRAFALALDRQGFPTTKGAGGRRERRGLGLAAEPDGGQR